MTVALPTGKIASATPRFIDRGGILRPSLGGSDQRLDRVGSKWGCDFQTVPMKGEDARVWIARLIRGRREKASIKFPQPGVVITTWLPSPPYLYLPAAANAEVIYLATGAVGQIIREGQFITLIKSGQRYVHQATAGVLSTSDVGVAISIQPPLRTSFVAGDLVEVVDAKIEGYVGGDEANWNIDNAKIYGLSFSIDEAR